MKKTLTILGLLAVAFATTFTWQSCKKSDSGSSSSSDVALFIQSGAVNLEPGQAMPYTAVIVNGKGETTPAANATWTVTGDGGASIGAFSGNVFTGSGTGFGTVTAKVTTGGKELSATVPVGVYTPALFTVVPSAIVWTTGAGTIPLQPVYIGTSTITGYSYSSSNPSVATVSSTGEVSFLAAGSCLITVTGNGLSANNKVYIPVMVVGMPPITLPVTRVTVTPGGSSIFRGDNVTLSAKAFNVSGNEVSSTFTWASQDPSVATVDASGKVTALQLGSTVITATAKGVVGQAEVQVLPDTAIIVTPYMASIAPDGYKQLVAKAYTVDHSSKAVSEITMPAGLKWEVPYTGGFFDIATVDENTGMVHMKATSTTPFMSTIVIAHVTSPTIDPGVAVISVSDCDCGTKAAGVTHISAPASVNLNITGGPQAVSAQALDASNNPVAGAVLKFCSDNMTVCTVDATTNQLIPVSPGNAIITVCNGDVQTTISVTVSF